MPTGTITAKSKDFKPAPKKLSLLKKFKNYILFTIYKIKHRKDIKLRKSFYIKMKELKNLTDYIDSQLFTNRQQKRKFWREFVTSGRVRNEVFEKLIKRYEIPNYILKEKKK